MNPPEISPLTGLLIVDKPLGWSSMDAIRHIRRSARDRKLKAGHAGTLDPLATGVLVCCIGKATKLVDQLMGQPKTYEADIDLSAFTTTDDREGDRQEITPPAIPTREQVITCLQTFIGDIQQSPPAYSAIHIDGRRAYDLARQGKAVDIPVRTVTVYAIELLSYDWPVARVRIDCGKGTYIRSIARDVGKALGTGGHLAALRRTRVGRFRVEDAMPGDRLKEHALTQDDLIPIDQAQSPGISIPGR